MALHAYALIDPRTNTIVATVEAVAAPTSHPKMQPGFFWAQCEDSDDSTIHQPNHPGVVRGKPRFELDGAGRAHRVFELLRPAK
jgi:hypothetical protein